MRNLFKRFIALFVKNTVVVRKVAAGKITMAMAENMTTGETVTVLWSRTVQPDASTLYAETGMILVKDRKEMIKVLKSFCYGSKVMTVGFDGQQLTKDLDSENIEAYLKAEGYKGSVNAVFAEHCECSMLSDSNVGSGWSTYKSFIEDEVLILKSLMALVK